jgi:hypothetical protein
MQCRTWINIHHKRSNKKINQVFRRKDVLLTIIPTRKNKDTKNKNKNKIGNKKRNKN